jgi:hypothetical protein
MFGAQAAVLVQEYRVMLALLVGLVLLKVLMRRRRRHLVDHEVTRKMAARGAGGANEA